jgi:ATP synthase protein I
MFRLTTRVAVFQIVILLAVAGIAWVNWDEKVAFSAAYGGAVALLATLLMLLRERESETHFEWTAQRQLGQVFRLEVERLILVGALLALGFLSGKAAPQALILGFVLGQLGWLAALRKQ